MAENFSAKSRCNVFFSDTPLPNVPAGPIIEEADDNEDATVGSQLAIPDKFAKLLAPVMAPFVEAVEQQRIAIEIKLDGLANVRDAAIEKYVEDNEDESEFRDECIEKFLADRKNDKVFEQECIDAKLEEDGFENKCIKKWLADHKNDEDFKDDCTTTWLEDHGNDKDFKQKCITAWLEDHGNDKDFKQKCIDAKLDAMSEEEGEEEEAEEGEEEEVEEVAEDPLTFVLNRFQSTSRRTDIRMLRRSDVRTLGFFDAWISRRSDARIF